MTSFSTSAKLSQHADNIRGNDGTGRFATQTHAASTVSLDHEGESPKAPHSTYGAFRATYGETREVTFGGKTTPVRTRSAETISEARKALKNANNRKAEPVMVDLGFFRGRRDAGHLKLEVTGPKSGEPLFINMAGGCNDLEVTSGNVVINAEHTHGGVVTVHEGAHLKVIVGDNVKYRVVNQGGTVEAELGGKSRGSVWADSGDTKVLGSREEYSRVYGKASFIEDQEHLAGF